MKEVDIQNITKKGVVLNHKAKQQSGSSTSDSACFKNHNPEVLDELLLTKKFYLYPTYCRLQAVYFHGTISYKENSISAIEKKTGISHSTLHRHLKELLALKYIVKTRIGNINLTSLRKKQGNIRFEITTSSSEKYISAGILAELVKKQSRKKLYMKSKELHRGQIHTPPEGFVSKVKLSNAEIARLLHVSIPVASQLKKQWVQFGLEFQRDIAEFGFMEKNQFRAFKASHAGKHGKVFQDKFGFVYYEKVADLVIRPTEEEKLIQKTNSFLKEAKSQKQISPSLTIAEQNLFKPLFLSIQARNKALDAIVLNRNAETEKAYHDAYDKANYAYMLYIAEGGKPPKISKQEREREFWWRVNKGYRQ